MKKPKSFRSLAEREFAEHKSIALRVFVSDMDPRDNVIKNHWKLMEDHIVLIRKREYDNARCPLEKDRKGWFLRLKEDSKLKTRVELDNERKCWAIKELI